MKRLVILGFKPGIYRGIIAELNTNLEDFTVKSSDVEILKAYNVANNIEELKEVLKDISNSEYKVDKYMVGYEGEISQGSLGESFNYEKHGHLMIRLIETIKEKVDREMEDILDKFRKKYKNFNDVEDIKRMYSDLIEIAETFFPMLKDVHQAITPITDRDFLDINIEIYNMLYTKSKGLKYGKEKVEEILNDEFMNKLLKYKMKKYGDEILRDIGMEVIGETQDGYIISETIPRKLN